MLTVIQTKIPQEALDYVEQHRSLLTPDHSQYANERLRCWLGAEAPLTDKRTFLPVPAPFGYDSRLWIWLDKFCKLHFNFEPEVALLHVGGANCGDPEETPDQGHGGQCGIMQHRDAAYADYRAIGINLIGEATFGYRSHYPYQDRWTAIPQQNKDAPLEHVQMTAGTCVAFNCKNPHFAQVGPNRWCINAWRISAKRRPEFEAFRGGGSIL
jgi:hypothetical protein